MNTDQIKAQIQLLTETISEQKDHLVKHEHPIPLIELDIMLGNIAKLYQQVSDLKKILHGGTATNAHPGVQPVPVQETPEIKILDTPPVSEVKEKQPIVSFVVRPSFVADADREPATEMRNRSQQEVLTEEKPAAVNMAGPDMNPDQPVEFPVREKAQAASPSPVKEEPSEPKQSVRKTTVQSMGLFDTVATVAGKYEEQPTLRDKISKNHTDSSLGKKYQQKAVEDLKKSIGINEKFSFINELFEGDLNVYNKSIDAINQSGDLSIAMQYITAELSPRYGWQPNSRTFQKLLELVERRFMK